MKLWPWRRARPEPAPRRWCRFNVMFSHENTECGVMSRIVAVDRIKRVEPGMFQSVEGCLLLVERLVRAEGAPFLDVIAVAEPFDRVCQRLGRPHAYIDGEILPPEGEVWRPGDWATDTEWRVSMRKEVRSKRGKD